MEELLEYIERMKSVGVDGRSMEVLAGFETALELVKRKALDIKETEKIQVEDRVQRVLRYLIPSYETDMNINQYNNAISALKTIHYGLPKGAKYNK